MTRARGSGELVTRAFDFDGGREVTVYVPPGPIEAVVFAGDGEVTSRWGPALDATEVAATMVVGVHRHADETLRLHEYSPGFDPDRFAAHERFLVDDVRHWIHDRFGVDAPRDRTAIHGMSAGAELALAIGLRHPDIFGAMLCASPGAGYRPPAAFPNAVPRTYLVAGNEEPFFLANATRWATALRRVGADVVIKERAGAHGDAFWRREFPLMVAWAFAG